MELSRKQVVSVARLAHLRLSDAEIERFRRDLASILQYIGRLETLDLTGVEPLFNPAAGDENVWRGDEPSAQDVTADFLRGAPAVRDRYVTVPQVVDADMTEEDDDEQ